MRTKTKRVSWSQQADDIAALEMLPDEKMVLFAEIAWEADEYRRKQEELQNATKPSKRRRR